MSLTKKWSLTKLKVDKCLVYDWSINNYNYLPSEYGEFLQSPEFNIKTETTKYILRVYPKSNKDGFVAIYIRRSDGTNLDFDGYCFLSVLNNKGEKFAEYKKKIDNNCAFCGSDMLIRHDILMDKTNGLLLNNNLTIRCELIRNCSYEQISSQDEEKIENPSESQPGPTGFEALFLDQRLSDVKLIASCGNSLPAHKSVLVNCSPVFKTMFMSDSEEWIDVKVGEVKIENGQYEALKEMLRYAYTAKVENITIIAADLIKLAKQYEIVGLSELCAGELSASISIDNAIEVLAIAERWKIEELRKRAMNFINAHVRDILNSNYFKSLTNIDVLKNVMDEMLRI